MSERNYSIDILKFICAILIVFIHTKWHFQQEFLPLTRCAVPCFFMISGYLLFDNERRTIPRKRLKRNIIHVGKILLWSTLLYFIWEELLNIIGNDGQFLIHSAMNWLKMAVLNVPLFGHHLWYLFAYLYVLLIMLLVDKYNKWKLLYFITPLLLLPHIILLVSGKYLSIYLIRNFLFLGLPFFAIGTFIKARSFGKSKKYRWLLLVGVVLFAITSLMERSILLSLGKLAKRELYFSSIFLTISMFMLAISAENHHKSWLSEMGEKYSLYIYLFHPVFVYCCETLFTRMDLQGVYMNIAPLLVLVSTMVFTKLLKLLRIIK